MNENLINKNEIDIISKEKYLNAFYINDNSLNEMKRNKNFYCQMIKNYCLV